MKCPNCNNEIKTRTTIGNAQYAFCYMCFGKVKKVLVNGSVKQIVYESIDRVTSDKGEDDETRKDSVNSSNTSLSHRDRQGRSYITETPRKVTPNNEGPEVDNRKTIPGNIQSTSTSKSENNGTSVSHPKQPVFTNWEKI